MSSQGHDGEAPLSSSIEVMQINSFGSQSEDMDYEESGGTEYLTRSPIPEHKLNKAKKDKSETPGEKKKQYDCPFNDFSDELLTDFVDTSKTGNSKKVKVDKIVDDQRNLRASAAESRMKKNKLLRRQRKPNTRYSPDLFNEKSSESVDNEDKSWSGCPLSDLTSLSPSNLNVAPVQATPDHSVYVKLPIREREIPLPYPSMYKDLWDNKHVKMPNSPSSLYPVDKEGKSVLVNRWSLIEKSLSKSITSMRELQATIFSYNNRYAGRWKFDGLRYLIEEDFNEEERNYFFQQLLPRIIELALSLPTVVTQPPILLTKNISRSISLSQKQIACMLANAFLCTFPRRNARGSDTEYATYPEINFNRFFSYKQKNALGKIKCILNYFKQVVSHDPDGIVTFTRQHIPFDEMPQFENCNSLLPKFHIDAKGVIEKASGLLQVDFANKYIGGGVLGLGCVQEEIRFVLCPELIVSMLFTEELEKNEALIITGVEQFNEGVGYASSFEWVKPYHDVTYRDPFKRRLCQVVGLDALHFQRNPNQQYRANNIMREVRKAYCGFRVLSGSDGTPTAVASGNWGCGVFRGDPKLKGLIQMVAAAVAGRDLAYFTFGDRELRDSLAGIHQFLVDNSITVGQLIMVLCRYGECRDSIDGSDLYQFIRFNLGSAHDSDTEPNVAKTIKPQNKKNCKTITDYFKVIPSKERISSSSSFRKAKDGDRNSTSPKKNRAVTEENISRVLTENDDVSDNENRCDEDAGGSLCTGERIWKGGEGRTKWGGGPTVKTFGGESEFSGERVGDRKSGRTSPPDDTRENAGLLHKLNMYDEKLS